MSLRIIQLSDSHLGAAFNFLGEKSAEHKKSIQKAFSKAVEYAVKNRVDLFLIGGDLFDIKNPSGLTVSFVKEQLELLADKAIHTIVLPGNHDHDRESSVYNSLASEFEDNPFIHVLNKDIVSNVQIKDLDCNIVGYMQMPSDGEEFLNKIKINPDYKYNIGLIHASIDMGRASVLRAIPIKKLKDFGFNYIALGDWHNTLEVDKNIWYSGSPEILSMDQKDVGKILDITVEESTVEVKEVEVGSIKIINHQIDISKITDIHEIIKELKGLSNPLSILNLKLTGLKKLELNIDIIQLKEQLNTSFYYINITDESQMTLSESEILEQSSNLVIGQFVKYIQDKNKSGEVDPKVADEALQLGVNLLRKK